MNAITTFTFAPALKLRAIDRDGESWFVAKDMCDALGIRTDHVRRDLDIDEIESAKLAGLAGKAPLMPEAQALIAVLKAHKPPSRVR